MSVERVPSDLRRVIAGGLRPVRPLRRPASRALYLLPFALLVWWGLYRLGLRPDAEQLGLLKLWLPSILQAGGGLAVLWIALLEAVPGRAVESRSLKLGAVALVGWLAGITWATWWWSPARVPPEYAGYYWRYCSGWPVVAALPLILVSLFLVRRAYPTRPALAGALCGLGAGLIVDASWRTYCEVSHPVHILDAHFLSLLAATVLGAVLGALLGRRR